MTAEELLRRSDVGERSELVRGELVLRPFESGEHGLVSGRVQFALGCWARDTGAGRVLAGGTGFLLSRDPDTVRAPDGAFLPQERVRGRRMGDGYVTTRPGLVVEVVSEQDEQEGIGMRVGAWLDFGVDEVWVVDPKRRTVTVHGAVRDARVYRHGEEVAGDGVLAGFSMQVAALFGV